VSAKKKAEPEYGLLGGVWHGALEMRHSLSTYYDEAGAYDRQEPTMHARLQFGAQFYDGAVDAYATLGVYNRASTQQFHQRRPELAVDFRPFAGPYFELLQYNTVKVPFQSEDKDPEAQEPILSEGSVYVFGLAPVVKAPFQAGATKITAKAGLDAWTKLYSRKQYTRGYDDGRTVEDEGRLGLVDTRPDTAETGEIEDSALHYDGQTLAGVVVHPGFLPDLKAEWTGHYHSSYRPRYTQYDSGTEHTYRVERYSYYRLRLEYELTPRVSVANELYHYYDGFYAGGSSGEDRRFRNVARLACKL
jgi:hypothetical protein